LESALGFRRIFLAGKEIKVVDGSHYKNSDVEKSIFVDVGKGDLFAILNLSPSAIVFSDMKINKKALEQMNERKIALCMPMSTLTSSYGLSRSRSLYMMSKLLTHARKIKLDVSFVTLAKSRTNLCSYIQLLELAKLIGADEEYARKSISEINKSLVGE
jgi:myo-inositol-hexaphosphate 3-phosphohydrolase